MSRSLVLGNGSMSVCYDEHGRLRDFYFPYVGLENHIGEHLMHRVGVHIDGAFSWVNKDEWEIYVDYGNETLVANIEVLNHQLGVRLFFQDVIYNEENIYARNVLVENRAEHERTIRVFFNQQFTIGGTSHADTAYYNPRERCIIHYKGRRVFLVSGFCEGDDFNQYTVGLMNTEGKEGTWRDAEDGVLEQNPIEHGSVDSTIGFTRSIEGRGTAIITYWITAGETFKENQKLHALVARKTVRHILKTTGDFWYAWANKLRFRFSGLDREVSDQFKKSLLVIRAHADRRGGILASLDGADTVYGKDTYGYVWPRDGAFISQALNQAGYSDISRRFFEFCVDVLTDEGYILHKYQPDRSLGSSWHPWIKEGEQQLAIQEDETAILLHGLWEYYKETKDLEFIELHYNEFIKEIADFLTSYRNTQTGLPAPSYDLWEEKYGISTYTASCVYGALSSAANFAELLGKEEDARTYRDVAESIKQGILTYLYDEDLGYFVKLINVDDQGGIHPDRTIDTSSFFGVFHFGVVPPNAACLAASFHTLQKTLSESIPVGGIARYEDDEYFTKTNNVPGNPWFITTLWAVQYTIARATCPSDLASVNTELRWVTDRALKSGILSEQLHPHTGEQVSVAPLAWSHAEYVRTVVQYMRKLERLGEANACEPIE